MRGDLGREVGRESTPAVLAEQKLPERRDGLGLVRRRRRLGHATRHGVARDDDDGVGVRDPHVPHVLVREVLAVRLLG